MAIYLTQEAQVHSKQSVESDVQDDSKHSWLIHSYLLSGKRIWVVIHCETGWFFVMQSLKKKELENLSETVQTYLLHYLNLMFIRPLIASELVDSLKIAKFVKSGRQKTGMIHKIREMIEIRSHLFDKSSRYNLEFFEACNNCLYFSQEGAEVLFERFIRFLKQEEISAISAQAYEMTVFLKLEEDDRTIFRHLLIPSHISFDKFSKILQSAFGYEGHHLHRFLCFDQNKNLTLSFVKKIEKDMELNLEDYEYNQEDYCLEDVVPHYPYIIFEYNYSVSWKHLVIIHDVIEDHPSLTAKLIQKEGYAPLDEFNSEIDFIETLEKMEQNQTLQVMNMKLKYHAASFKSEHLWIVQRGFKQLPMHQVDQSKLS